jgi:hypothetical protein
MITNIFRSPSSSALSSKTSDTIPLATSSPFSPNQVSSSSFCAITDDEATPAAARIIIAHRRRVTSIRITGMCMLSSLF